MTYILYAHCEVDCDDGRTATSPSASYRLHKKSDEPNLFFHKQNIIDEVSVFSLKHNLQRFLQTLEQGHACISWLMLCLFRFVYNVFCSLGTVFLFFWQLFLRVFCDKQLATYFYKICTYLNDHLPSWRVYQKVQVVLFRDTIYKVWLTCSALSSGRRSITC